MTQTPPAPTTDPVPPDTAPDQTVSEETVPLHGLRAPTTAAYPQWTRPAPPPGPRPDRQGTGLAAGVLAGSLVVGLVAGVGGAAAYERLRATNDAPPTGAASVSSVAEQVLPSVVRISVATDDGDAESGSGTILSADGEILTTSHVAELADSDDATLTVTFDDGTDTEAELVGRDPKTDLALLRVDADGLTPIPLADSDDLEVGQPVVAVGSPYGPDATVATGIVSALHRPVAMDLEDGSGVSVYGAIRTDAPIDRGGALVTLDGELVGVSADGPESDDSHPGGTGYAIPVAVAGPILDQLRVGETPTHARLGVSGKDADPAPGLPGGAEITDVSEDSAAETAGLEYGDTVVAVDGVPVGSWDALLAAVYAHRPGDTAGVTFDRDGEERTAEVRFGSDSAE